jgi:hypothetical protein
MVVLVVLVLIPNLKSDCVYREVVNLVREEVLGIPVIAASGKTNLYIIWAANFTGNYIIWLKKSADGGNTFSDPVNLTIRNRLSSSLV